MCSVHWSTVQVGSLGTIDSPLSLCVREHILWCSLDGTAYWSISRSLCWHWGVWDALKTGKVTQCFRFAIATFNVSLERSKRLAGSLLSYCLILQSLAERNKGFLFTQLLNTRLPPAVQDGTGQSSGHLGSIGTGFRSSKSFFDM